MRRQGGCGAGRGGWVQLAPGSAWRRGWVGLQPGRQQQSTCTQWPARRKDGRKGAKGKEKKERRERKQRGASSRACSQRASQGPATQHQAEAQRATPARGGSHHPHIQGHRGSNEVLTQVHHIQKLPLTACRAATYQPSAGHAKPRTLGACGTSAQIPRLLPAAFTWP